MEINHFRAWLEVRKLRDRNIVSLLTDLAVNLCLAHDLFDLHAWNEHSTANEDWFEGSIINPPITPCLMPSK